jgi:prephenate dehydrogenase
VSLTSGVAVVGAGLIGSSVGLALRRRGVTVHLHDRDRSAAAFAAALGAGVDTVPASPPELVVAAVPPDQVADVVTDALHRWPHAVVTDVASVKVQPLRQLRARQIDLRRYVGSHPMAGSERSGAAAARADLFAHRPWAVTPHPDSSAQAVAVVEYLVELCEAEAVRVSPAAHDQAVAVVSHAPYLQAVLTAARLNGITDSDASLAGPALRDITRVAASDPALWAQILAANSEPVARVLAEISADLDEVLRSLAIEDAALRTATLERLLAQGVAGTERIPPQRSG